MKNVIDGQRVLAAVPLPGVARGRNRPAGHWGEKSCSEAVHRNEPGVCRAYGHQTTVKLRPHASNQGKPEDNSEGTRPPITIRKRRRSSTVSSASPQGLACLIFARFREEREMGYSKVMAPTGRRGRCGPPAAGRGRPSPACSWPGLSIPNDQGLGLLKATICRAFPHTLCRRPAYDLLAGRTFEWRDHHLGKIFCLRSPAKPLY